MQIAGVLETCLYAVDLAAAEDFYTRVLGLELFSRAEGRHIFFRCGQGVLLIFNPQRTSAEQSQVGGVPVPLHGAQGAGHVAFSIRAPDLEQWRAHLEHLQLPIEAEIEWPRGGRSIYLRDPAGNSIELAEPRIWGLAVAPAADR